LAKQIVRLRLDAYHQANFPAVCNGLSRHRTHDEKDYPEVEDFCRLIDANLLLANDEKRKIFRRQGLPCRRLFLRMFNVKLKKGDPKTALDGRKRWFNERKSILAMKIRLASDWFTGILLLRAYSM
jgi:hypothetical protein